jgi:hypothetical protein
MPLSCCSGRLAKHRQCDKPPDGGERRHGTKTDVQTAGSPVGFKPLLVMDVWEHAFMRDYAAIKRRLREPGAVRLAAAG